MLMCKCNYNDFLQQVINIRGLKCHAYLITLKHFGLFSLFCKHNRNYSVNRNLMMAFSFARKVKFPKPYVI